MKKLILTLLVLISSSPSLVYSREGNEGTGGGDPLAWEFAVTAGAIAHYLNQNPNFVPGLNVQKMNDWVRRLRQSLYLDNGGLIRMEAQRPRDRFGVEKDATADTQTMIVRVHQPTWQSSDIPRKLSLVAMEIFWMSDVNSDRYSFALLIGQRSPEVLGLFRQHGMSCLSYYETFASAANTLADQSAPCAPSNAGLRTQARQSYENFQRECSASFVPAVAEFMTQLQTSFNSIQALQCQN